MKIKKSQSVPKNIEEILEFIVADEPRDKCLITELIDFYGEKIKYLLDKMVSQKIITIDDKYIYLTDIGKEKATEVIRRHRLAECLLKDVFEVKDFVMESSACEFEHILMPELTESICTFLGHPTKCPHGKYIPPGNCCKQFKIVIPPLVKPLKDLDTGSNAIIVFITSQAKHSIGKLGSLGITPGQTIRLIQKSPSFIIKLDNTMLALDDTIASQIYVKPIPHPDTK
jgi:DtxR family Mn-dependent transcriptional regulator